MNLLNSESNILEQSSNIALQLKPHQKTILYAANNLEQGKSNFNPSIDSIAGVLADNVGSGKSLSILSIIANNPFLKTRNRCIKSINGMINVYNNPSNRKYINTNIIVVPHSIINQWVSYINTHTNLSYYIINNKKTYTKVEENFEILNQYCITLISSTKYKDFVHIFKYQNNTNYNENPIKYIVSRLIFDEADSINIPACTEIESTFYWFITSSYNTLLNPNGKIKYFNPITNEFNNNYDWINGFTKRVYLDGIKTTGFIKNFFKESYNTDFINIFLKNEDEFVSNSFKLPDPCINLIECTNPIVISILNGIIPKDVLIKLNAGDTKGAIESIDCTKTDDNNLIKIFTNELETKLHNTILILESKQKMKFSSDKAKKDSIMKLKIKISEIKDKINSITDRITNSNMCTICYDNIQNNTISKCCNHTFCFECITIWLSQSVNHGCPMCRAKITTNDLVIVSNECPMEKETNESNTKIDNFIKIIDNIDINSKLLIFSEFDATFDNIKETLDTKNINYSKVVGTSSSINKIIKNYKLDNQNTDSIQVLLLNSKYFGSGLNLENTTDLIIFHAMNNDLNKQIVGRAQRPGRKSPLNIWRLCYENEMHQTFSV